MKAVIYFVFGLCLLGGRSLAQTTYVPLGGNYSDYYFANDTTYYVSNNVTLTGTTTLNGGAVIKFAANKSITVNDSIVCATAPYHPAIFTAKDDDTVGELITGSTGTPTNYYAAVALQLMLTNTAALSNLCFAHAQTALACLEDIDSPDVTNVLQNLLVVHCARGLWVMGAANIGAEPPEESFSSFSGGEDNNLTNRLFLHNTLFLQVNHVITGQTAIVVAENMTVDRAAAVVSGNGAALAAFWPVVYSYNSVFSRVTNLTAGYASLYGGYNGFYQSPMFGGPTNGVSIYPFASDGWYDHYLTNTSPFVDDGDVTAATAGLDDYSTQTNQTLDTGDVDLGWHYPVLLNLAARCNTNGAGIALYWELTDLIDNLFFVNGYEIYRRTTPGAFTLSDRIGLIESGASSYAYVDFGTVPGQTYYYAVLLLHFVGYDENSKPIYRRLPYPATESWTACCPVDSSTNLWVNYGYSATQLAQWLMGTNPVTVSHASYTGAASAIGLFGNGDGVGLGGHQFPFDTGVILSSGRIANANGPNDDSGASVNYGKSSQLEQPGDGDLDELVGGGPTTNATVLEFDIVATNVITLTFHYDFASEEYPEWIGQFNDPMAIFVTTNRVGTNWIITTNNNIAMVPGTNLPVSVNTINGGFTGGYVDGANRPAVSPTNPQYYVDNHDPSPSRIAATNAAPSAVYNIQYDGFTTNLTAQIYISAGIANHIKIAVADYNDDLYDSAVFNEAQVIPCP